MKHVNEELVRIRAYYIWEREGRPEGRGQDHWHAAIREISMEAVALNGAAEKPSVTESKSKPGGAPRKSRIGSIAAKAKDALEGGPSTAKPAEPKRKRAPKADKGSSKRSPRIE